ncbi:hypothetical protein NPX13_g4606 [Xylaria arbuscula]|uniref:Uncharacterized protein n=1 Tax=Xylaria arbuscula TaxID=114810 RepID=A0A9W8TLS5_9PEZI|nr:hypothetical protein NPX13_g4606 [Xylaria arbuscula]
MSSYCFNYVDGELTTYNLNSEPHYFPCGPVNETNPAVPCCAWGDSCLGGGICTYTHSLAGGSGYYAAACTDKTFQDDACKSLCGDQSRPDVTYLADRDLWACCGTDENDNLDCADPTDETFKLDAPEDLPVLFKVPATGFNYTSESIAASTSFSSPTTSLITTATSTSLTTTSTPQPTTSSGLSSGAAAGIGVGVAAIVIIAAILAWLAFRRRRQHLATTSQGEAQPLSELSGHGEKGSTTETLPHSNNPKRRSQVPELTGHQIPSELPG